MGSRLLTTKEAAFHLQVSLSTIYRHGPTLPGYLRVGRRIFFSRAALQAFGANPWPPNEDAAHA